MSLKETKNFGMIMGTVFVSLSILLLIAAIYREQSFDAIMLFILYLIPGLMFLYIGWERKPLTQVISMNEEVEELEVIIKKIRYKNIVWIPEHTKIKRPYIIKWIEKKQVGDVFTKDEFYKEHPKIKKEKVRRRCVDESIQKMILAGRIGQHEILGQYKVLK